MQMGHGAGQGSVPEGSGSLRAFGGSAQGVRVSCASGSAVLPGHLATAVEGGQTQQVGTHEGTGEPSGGVEEDC